MSVLPTGCFQPLARVEDLERLVLLDPPREQSHKEAGAPEPVDWDEVHRVIQDCLEDMVSAIREGWPKIHSRAGSSSASAYFLFSFRSFSPAKKGDHEPIVVGVVLQPRGDRVLVRGDICCEESGDILYESGSPKEVPGTRKAVLQAAKSVSTKLCEQADLVVRALEAADPRSPK